MKFIEAKCSKQLLDLRQQAFKNNQATRTTEGHMLYISSHNEKGRRKHPNKTEKDNPSYYKRGRRQRNLLLLYFASILTMCCTTLLFVTAPIISNMNSTMQDKDRAFRQFLESSTFVSTAHPVQLQYDYITNEVLPVTSF